MNFERHLSVSDCILELRTKILIKYHFFVLMHIQLDPLYSLFLTALDSNWISPNLFWEKSWKMKWALSVSLTIRPHKCFKRHLDSLKQPNARWLESIKHRTPLIQGRQNVGDERIIFCNYNQRRGVTKDGPNLGGYFYSVSQKEKKENVNSSFGKTIGPYTETDDNSSNGKCKCGLVVKVVRKDPNKGPTRQECITHVPETLGYVDTIRGEIIYHNSNSCISSRIIWENKI